MPETTEKYHRIPTGKKKKKDSEIRTITIRGGIKALYDVKNKVIITYLFDVKRYTMKQAKQWVKDHKTEKSYIIMAENDYLLNKINEVFEEKKRKILDLVKDLKQ